MLNNNCIINIEESDDNAKETREHSVEKAKIYSHLKKFREIILYYDLLAKMFISRNW